MLNQSRTQARGYSVHRPEFQLPLQEGRGKGSGPGPVALDISPRSSAKVSPIAEAQRLPRDFPAVECRFGRQTRRRYRPHWSVPALQIGKCTGIGLPALLFQSCLGD